MLDDLKLIHERDTDDTLGIAGRQWQQLTEKFDVNVDGSGIENIVFLKPKKKVRGLLLLLVAENLAR